MNIDSFVNLIIVLNIILTLSANVKSASIGFKSKFGGFKEKPKTWLQFWPKLISTLIFLFVVAGLFGVGRLKIIPEDFSFVRITAVFIYVTSSWLQIWSCRECKDLNTPDIVIFKNHRVIDSGIYKVLRHPVYLTQILQDLMVGIALMNCLVLSFTIVLESPMLILRANYEEKLLLKHFPDDYLNYQKRVYKWFPFPTRQLTDGFAKKKRANR